MLVDIVSVRALGGHRLWLEFEDGTKGQIDFAARLEFDGVFAPLRDEREFARVHLNRELGTIAWPNGADLAPETLYEWVVRS